MLSQQSAETIALNCLAWLAGNEELLPIFMGSTGANAEDLAIGAQDPDFLGSVLDFLLMDDAWILAFCADYDLPNEAPLHAQMHLSGGAGMHWT